MSEADHFVRPPKSNLHPKSVRFDSLNMRLSGLSWLEKKYDYYRLVRRKSIFFVRKKGTCFVIIYYVKCTGTIFVRNFCWQTFVAFQGIWKVKWEFVGPMVKLREIHTKKKWDEKVVQKKKRTPSLFCPFNLCYIQDSYIHHIHKKPPSFYYGAQQCGNCGN